MKKRMISVILAALLAFTGAGCGSTGGESAAAAGKDLTPATSEESAPEEAEQESPAPTEETVTPEAMNTASATPEAVATEAAVNPDEAAAEATTAPEETEVENTEATETPEEAAAPQSAIPAELTLASPVLPLTVPCPNEEDYYGEDGVFDEKAYEADRQVWADAVMARQEQIDGLDRTGVFSFTEQLVPDVLGNIGENNGSVSPVNVYMALAMLAEISGGNTRDQVLTVLGEDSIESLRENVSRLWLAAYSDDASGTTILGDAVWLRDDSVYKEEALKQLAETYYASAFEGKMGDPAYDDALQTWLNEQTHGLLTEQAGGLGFSPETVLALTSSIYFKGGWSSEFMENNTKPDIFHAPAADVEVPFMRETTDQTYWKGDKFGAVCKPFNKGNMFLILPDEGVTPAEVLADGQYMELFTDVETIPNKFLKVSLSVPKFDIASDLEISRNLKNLGAGLVFDPALSDFTSITNDPLFVSTVKHAARVKIDEEGCEAAAYTAVVMEVASAFTDDMEEMAFICDRPFIFVITGDWDIPLFVGVVNDPTK